MNGLVIPEKRFCNCCGKLKPVALASTEETYFCRKCATYGHRQRYQQKRYETGFGCAP